MTITVTEAQHGTRIDIVLADGLGSRSNAQKLLENGMVSCNGKTVAKKYKVEVGDVLACNMPTPQPSAAQAQDIPLSVIYEDEHLLVVNKPQGLVVHPGAGNAEGTLVNALLHHCNGALSGIGGVLRPGIVHRLDKDTSGIMVVAKSDAAHRGLAAQIATRTMLREYIALCFGAVAHAAIKINAPIGRHPVSRTKMAVLPGARQAVTYVEKLQALGKYTLVRARLETGRTHQIRVHMAHIGHPIMGDELYGRPGPPFARAGQLLHACGLAFAHPVSGRSMQFEAPLTQYFENALATLRAQ